MDPRRKRGKGAKAADLEVARITARERWNHVMKLAAGGGLTAAAASDAKTALDTYRRLLKTQPARTRNTVTAKRKKVR